MTRRLAALALLFAAPALADEPAWEYAVTRGGRPAAGVKVALTPYAYPTPGGPKAGEPTFATTDAAGIVRVPKALAGDGGYVRVLARDPDGRSGYGGVYASTKSPPVIDLREPAELTGRFTDEAGRPVAGLTLTPTALGPESFTRYGGRPVTLAETPPWFWDGFAPAVAADGTVTLRGVPAQHSVAVKFAAPGHGAGTLWLVPGRPAAVTLAKAGAVTVRLNGRGRDARVVLTRQPGGPVPLDATAEGVVKGSGALTLPNLPPGTYKVLFRADEPAAAYPKAVPAVTVAPGGTAEVNTEFEPAATVTAALVDSKTGAGVPGGRVEVRVTLPDGQFPAVFHPTSGADGRLGVSVPAGMVTAAPSAPTGYAVGKFTANPFNQYSTEPVPLKPGGRHDLGRFPLVPTVDVAGVVVDPEGRPVAGASVSAGYSGSNFSRGGAVVSAADGTFALKGLNPEGGVVGLTARKGDAVTAAPLAVDPGKLDGDVRVVVSATFAARVKARAVDRSGRPVPGAAVELAHSITYLSRGGGVVGGGTAQRVGSTGPDGVFASDVLQPGDRYGVTFTAPGYRGVTGPDWVAEPGRTHDFGDLRLTRADLVVTGTVRDLTGQPVPGATVFSNADGPRPTAATTDAAGRFTLPGLYEGPAYVSVKAAGFRVASAPAEPGGPPVAVALRRDSDPPAAPPVISDEHKAATAKLTRHLLEKMWSARVEAKDDGKSTLAAMARVDFATARTWADEEKARPGGADLSAVLDRAAGGRPLLDVATEDPDEAVALLKSLSGAEGFRAVCALGRELAAVAPDKALRVAEDAVTRARGLEQSSRPWALAEAGEVVYRAGRRDAGRKLIEEAAALAEPLGYDGLDAYVRGMAAARVALFDPAKARRMIDPIKDANEFDRYLAEACVRAAVNDLPTATAWLADFRPGNSLSDKNARQRIAYGLAATKPDEAAAVAAAIPDKTYRAVTLAGVAARVQDKARAARLIDAALDPIVADPTGYYTNNGGGGGTAAIVLYRAKEAGHPDLAAARDKVLAARSAPLGGPFRNGDPAVPVALALALTDPATARALLLRTAPVAELTKVEGIREREKLIALALAAPDLAVRAVDVLIADAVKGKQGFRTAGLDALAVVLTQPERRAYHAHRYGGLVWDFEEE